MKDNQSAVANTEMSAGDVHHDDHWVKHEGNADKSRLEINEIQWVQVLDVVWVRKSQSSSYTYGFETS